jgi:hypothetical protein
MHPLNAPLKGVNDQAPDLMQIVVAARASSLALRARLLDADCGFNVFLPAAVG